jgi:N-acetylglucosamine kinase-like BadF-type ATPase
LAKLFLGVDGGQSRTKAWIGDETGRVLGAGAGGPCNHVGAAEGAAKLTRAVGECVGNACEQAGLDPAQVLFEAACFGMSGGPEDKEELLGRILRVKKWIVTHDAVIALSGATAGEPGVVAIAGTGSIAFGRNALGQTARAGGWGYVFGDEGGGFDIARQALRAALRFEEGWGRSTILRDRLLQTSGSASANDLLHRFYTDEYPRPRIAALARLVEQSAEEGDEVAAGILNGAAQQLAMLAASVRRQLWKDGDAVRIAHVGGLFRSGRLRARFELLVEMESGNRCQPPAYDPVGGALLEAYQAAGLHPKLSVSPEFHL